MTIYDGTCQCPECDCRETVAPDESLCAPCVDGDHTPAPREEIPYPAERMSLAESYVAAWQLHQELHSGR